MERLFLRLGLGWVEDKEENFVKMLSCSCQIDYVKEIIYKIFCSLPLKGNCLFFFSFANGELISCFHPMPKVAISKQREVNGREQFRCNLFPSSACVLVST